MSQTEAEKPPHGRWGPRIVVVVVGAIVAPLALTLLYNCYTPDGTNTYFPGCYFNSMTGLHCPGCGATRALYSVLHFDFWQALAYNPLFVIILPFLIYGLFRMAWKMWTGNDAPGYGMPRWMTKYVLWTILTYWVIRNIPYPPFDQLAPHSIAQPKDAAPAKSEPEA